MNKPILGPYIIGSAIIWGGTILGASLRLAEVEARSGVLSLLGLGAALHLILIWGPLAGALKKSRQSGDVEGVE